MKHHERNLNIELEKGMIACLHYVLAFKKTYKSKDARMTAATLTDVSIKINLFIKLKPPAIRYRSFVCRRIS